MKWRWWPEAPRAWPFNPRSNEIVVMTGPQYEHHIKKFRGLCEVTPQRQPCLLDWHTIREHYKPFSAWRPAGNKFSYLPVLPSVAVALRSHCQDCFGSSTPPPFDFLVHVRCVVHPFLRIGNELMI